MLGLQGNVDASVEISNKVAPLEIKTGKVSAGISHRAQTTLYAILMSDRHDKSSIDYGLLSYINADIQKVDLIWEDIRAMLIQRNLVAYYLNSQMKLPEVINDRIKCNYCGYANHCMVNHKV